MKRIWLTSVFALALSTAACAENEAETIAEAISEADTTSQEASLNETSEVVGTETAEEAVAYDFPDDVWRSVPQDRLLYIETDHGMIVIELAPEFAPLHAERMTTLANNRFYDFLVWHRVLDGFVAQGGGARSNPAHSTDLPNLPAEFTIRRNPAEMPLFETQDRVVNPRSNPSQARAGFWNGFPAGTQSSALAGITADGSVESWLLHCQGAASMARTNDPNSAGSQFYITRGDAEHLNTQYTVWGRVRAGQDAVQAIRLGTLGQDIGFSPDSIQSMRIGTDPEFDGQVNVEVIDTNSQAFADWLSAQGENGTPPDVCAVEIPVRITE